MANTIADIIKESSENEGLSEAVGSPINSGLTLYDQAKLLLKNDKRDFQRLGTNFLVPLTLYNLLNIEFNKFLAEPLLREGSLLLDRCLQQRKEYQELHTKWFEACVQIDEMTRLNAITENEEKTYETPAKIVEDEKLALEKEKATLDKSTVKLNQALQLTKDKKAILVQEACNTAWSLALVALVGTPDPEHKWEDPNITPTRIVREHARENAKLSVQFDKDIQQYGFENQVAINNGNSDALTEKINSAEKSIEYTKEKATFQIQRNEVARLVAARRAEQLTKEDGALNFLEQMKPIKERFKNDLISAYLRLEKAHAGFVKLYGAEYPIGSFPTLVPVDPNDLQKPELTDLPVPPPIADFAGKFDFDSLVTWCQLTNTWLASFLDKQQQVTRSFSLKKLINNDAIFEAGKAQSEWRFKLKDTDFSNMRFVRMRSFAVQIDSGHQSGNWNVSITPPPKAENDPKEQGDIGTLYLGRVNERTFAVISEGSAPPKLFNASPIGEDSPSGEWTIEVLSSSTSGATVNDIEDIDIHLTVAIV